VQKILLAFLLEFEGHFLQANKCHAVASELIASNSGQEPGMTMLPDGRQTTVPRVGIPGHNQA